MTLYLKCPNGCTGEVPMGVETDDADPSVGIFSPIHHTYVDDRYNPTSHDPGCPPLTDEQILALQDEGDEKVNDPEYGYGNDEP